MCNYWNVWLFSLVLYCGGILIPLEAWATKYYAPQNSISFDVNQLELDVDRMNRLSKFLTTIAQREHNQMDPRELRTNAKLVYLAQQLNPKNKAIKFLNKQFIIAAETNFVDSKSFKNAVRNIKNYCISLEKFESKHAHLLNKMIKDVLSSIKTIEDPFFKKIKKNEELWNQIPKLDLYKNPGIRPNPNAQLEDDPETKPSKPENEVVRTESSVNFPLFKTHEQQKVLLDLDFNQQDGAFSNIGKLILEKKEGVKWDKIKDARALTFESNSGLYFNHSNQFRNFKNLQNFTIEAVIYAASDQLTGSILSKTNDNTEENDLHSSWDLSLQKGKLQLLIRSQKQTEDKIIITKDSIPSGKWLHLAVLCETAEDKRKFRFYVNGEKWASEPIKTGKSNLPQTRAQLSLGSRVDQNSDLKNISFHKIRILRGLVNPEPPEGDNALVARSQDEKPENPSLDKSQKSQETTLSFYKKGNGFKDQNGVEPSINDKVELVETNPSNEIVFRSKGMLAYPNKGSFDRDQAFTFRTWVKFENPGTNGPLIAKIDAKEEIKGWGIFFEKGKIFVYLAHHSNNEKIAVCTRKSVPIDKWLNLFVTYDGSSKAEGISIFCNGEILEVITKQDNLTKSIANKSDLTIGHIDAKNRFLTDFRLLSMHLAAGMESPENISNFYQSSKKIAELQKKFADSKSNLNIPVPVSLNTKKIKVLSPMFQIVTLPKKKTEEKPVIATVEVYDKGKTNSELLKLELELENEDEDFLFRLSETIHNGLGVKLKHPKNLSAKVQLAKPYLRSNVFSISGPVAVALGAGMANKEIPENTVICAYISKNGKFTCSRRLWYQMPALTQSDKSHRIIVGEGGDRLFKQLLPSKNLGFFINNEVIEISSLSSAVEAATGSNPSLEKASAIFKEIQNNSNQQSIKGESLKEDLQGKLKRILNLAPNHVSASAILLWGMDRRPKTYDPFLTNTLLWDSFSKVRWITSKDFSDLHRPHVEKMSDQLKSQLDSIETFRNPEYETIFNNINEAALLMKSFSKIRMNREKQSNAQFEKIKKLFKTIENDFQQKHKK